MLAYLLCFDISSAIIKLRAGKLYVPWFKFRSKRLPLQFLFRPILFYALISSLCLPILMDTLSLLLVTGRSGSYVQNDYLVSLFMTCAKNSTSLFLLQVFGRAS